jgi:hypothetical protein
MDKPETQATLDTRQWATMETRPRVPRNTTTNKQTKNKNTKNTTQKKLYKR